MSRAMIPMTTRSSTSVNAPRFPLVKGGLAKADDMSQSSSRDHDDAADGYGSRGIDRQPLRTGNEAYAVAGVVGRDTNVRRPITKAEVNAVCSRKSIRKLLPEADCQTIS